MIGAASTTLAMFLPHLQPFQADSSRCRQDLRNANEIVGGGGQDEEPFNQCPSAMARFAQATDGLDPAEGFLDPLPLDRADAIARVAGGAGIDRRAAVRVVLRDVRRAATFAASGHEVSGIVVLSPPTVLPGLTLSLIMSSAVSRSAVPFASVTRASTMSPLRFSVIRCPDLSYFFGPVLA